MVERQNKGINSEPIFPREEALDSSLPVDKSEAQAADDALRAFLNGEDQRKDPFIPLIREGISALGDIEKMNAFADKMKDTSTPPKYRHSIPTNQENSTPGTGSDS